MRKILLPLFFAQLNLVSLLLQAQNKQYFGSIDSVLQYAEKNSSVIRSGNEQALLAKWTKIASLGNTINLRSPITASWTDNTQLPVNYIPAEAFGGPAGTVKELTFGQTYITTYGLTPQIDVINPAAWARVKSASVNQKLTETSNLIAKKNLFESVAASYFNILSVQLQITSLELSVSAADSILAIVNNKWKEGIAREQDKNNAEINVLTITDKIAQLKAGLEQQYNTLKLLCDIQQETTLLLNENLVPNESPAIPQTLSVSSQLLSKQQELQKAYLKSELKYNRLLSFAPTVSFIFNQSWQNSSNLGFFDANSFHFSTQYFGVKLSVPLPIDVNHLTQNYAAKINYSLSKISSEHANLQNQTNDKQVELDYQKALSSYSTAEKILRLKKENYLKSRNQYQAGILSTENLLSAYIDNVNAELNLINSASVLRYAITKIKINTAIR